MATKLQKAMESGFARITGNCITLDDSGKYGVVLDAISLDLEKKTGIDSCDWAIWIKKSLNEYVLEYANYA
jgi:hypothetical protein